MAKTGSSSNKCNTNDKTNRKKKDKKGDKQKIDGDNNTTSNKTKKKDESKLPVVSVIKKSIKHDHVKQGLLKTPTQLHNARKRRAKQKKKMQQGQGGGGGGTTTTALVGVDPSSQYLSNPYSAPIVVAAKRFFANRLPAENSSFKVYQNGPKIGWRTVSKLPVRRCSITSGGGGSGGKKKSKVVVGMFQPQTHQIQQARGSSSCYYPAHHPSINASIKTLEASCQEMGIDVYNEHSGTGYLRYVAMNVERSSGKVQLTLIWKDTPYDELEFDLQQPKSKNSKKNKKKRKRTTSTKNSQEDDDPTTTTTKRDIAKAQLERLLIHLLKLGTTTTTSDESSSSSPTRKSDTSGSTSSFKLHSLWVHYNDSWKHSNAIFDIHSTSTESVWKHIYGPKTIAEQLLSLPSTTTKANNKNHTITPTLHFSPNVFRQANLDAFAYIIQSIQRRIQKMRKNNNKANNNNNNNNSSQSLINCLELYGGVGTIGLHLLEYIDCLVCSDENPYNQDCFEASKQKLLLLEQQQEQQQNGASRSKCKGQQQQCGSITYVPKSASDMVQDGHYLHNKQIVIVDPPRKGLDDVVLDSLLLSASGGVQLLIYISCGFDAFQRDCQRLMTPSSSSSSSCWQLEHAEGHILFPGSNAIETLAYFVPAQR